MASSSAAPTMKPATVPASARSAVAPVADAFARSTDSVPGTAQNAFWTLERSATATAAARATALRARSSGTLPSGCWRACSEWSSR